MSDCGDCGDCGCDCTCCTQYTDPACEICGDACCTLSKWMCALACFPCWLMCLRNTEHSDQVQKPNATQSPESLKTPKELTMV